LAEPPSNPLQRPLPDSFVPEAIVARTESHWAMIMAAMLRTCPEITESAFERVKYGFTTI
jgi:hypothetical protein